MSLRNNLNFSKRSGFRQLPPKKRAAFTLVELLVVIAVIGILVGLLLPAVQAAREAARRMNCSNNMVQLAIAIHNYEMAHRCLPPGTVDSKGPIVHMPVGYHHSWIVQILPMIDEGVAYKTMNHSESVYAKSNTPVRNYPVQVLGCPSDPSGAGSTFSNYAGVHDSRETPIDVDNNGLLFLNSRVTYDEITDGISKTMMLVEKGNDVSDLGWCSGTRATLRNMGSTPNFVANPAAANNPGWGAAPPGTTGFSGTDGMGYGGGSYGGGMYGGGGYGGEGYGAESSEFAVQTADLNASDEAQAAPKVYDPANPTTWISVADLPEIIPGKPNTGSDVGGPSSFHTGGVNCAMADGAVMFLSQNIDPAVQQQLGNRKDGTLMYNFPY